MTQRVFSSQNELMQFGQSFLTERLDSLENDVQRCIGNCPGTQPAPFPAILYCFSTIDLLAALLSGVADEQPGVTERARNYMTSYMDYTDEQAILLQKVFRHKLVHLAQPHPITKYGQMKIAWWELNVPDRSAHLLLEALPSGTKATVTVRGQVDCTHRLTVSIPSLKEDIQNSVLRPSGYLEDLRAKPDLQDRFEKAISVILRE